jgi:HK97 family phage major capsid protein
MKPAEMRARAAELHRQAQALYNETKDSPAGMGDDAAKRYDALLDESEGLLTKATDEETRLRRMNDMEARLSARDSARPYNDDALPHQDSRNARNGLHAYSVLKALRQTMLQREGRGVLDGLEAEIHQELDERRFRLSGRRAKGVMIPWDLPVDTVAAEHYRGRALPPAFEGGRETRALTTTTGVGAIPTILSTDLISILRSRLVCANMGMTILPDMQGLFAIPRQSATVVGSWVAEGTAPTGANQTIDQVAFSPKTSAAFTDYTRRFLEQTAIAPEMFVREDLMNVIARTVELACINGGLVNGPIGVMANAIISAAATPIGATGGNPTWGTFVQMESAVAIANADVGSLGYITNASVRGYTKVAPKITASTFPVFIWEAGAKPLNDYPVGITNLVPNNLVKSTGTNLSAILFGNWADLVLCLWSGLDVLVDPYTGSSSGTVRVVCMQDADVNVRHPESFNICVDAKTV